jgi:RNA polymerase sigma factor (sigma-70 family)
MPERIEGHGDVAMTAGDFSPNPPGSTPAPPCASDLAEVRAEWIQFYDAHLLRVIRVLMHDGASLQDAQDAAQEAFTEAWAMMTSFPARWSAVANKGAWVRIVALRKYRRPPGPRKRPQPAGGDMVVPDSPHPGLEPGELTVQTQTVLKTLRGLSPQERAVMAFHLDDFSTAEIAAALGISDQKVRDARKKARAALRRAFAQAEVTEGGTHGER